jgi:hypothetical protein
MWSTCLSIIKSPRLLDLSFLELILALTYISLQVLDRGEKIELLVDKTENLRSQVCASKIGFFKQLPFSVWSFGFMLQVTA